MRKYMFSGGVIAAVFGILSPLKATRKGPRDWRLGLAWAGWALSLAVAIVTVRDRSEIVARKQRARRN